MSFKKFQETILTFYRQNSRIFAWRETKNPYHILISEIMLQQTQTERVKIKYEEWLKHFPTLETLAAAPLQKVLTQWQGLGYNRRALALKRTAETVVKNYNGVFPKTFEEILELPGIGPYTAGAIMAFAYNKPIPIIETNIRTVYIHFFFPKDHGQIHDKEILKLVAQTLPEKNVREWYYALMDYGVMLKKTLGNLNKKSRHYTKQSQFKGSNREIRSNILKAITAKPVTEKDILNYLKKSDIAVTPEQYAKNISDLEREGFIIQQKNKFYIAS
jgi:A/G-specific adenine glycosylase